MSQVADELAPAERRALERLPFSLAGHTVAWWLCGDPTLALVTLVDTYQHQAPNRDLATECSS